MSASDPSRRILIVNADDFGRTRAINSGVIRAYEQGIVTSASLMVRWPAARAAAEYCRAHPQLGAGLHLDLGEWVLRGGRWVTVYEVVELEDDARPLLAEAERQLEQFRRLVGRNPTHLDSHQHVHTRTLTGTFRAFADALRIPLRDNDAAIAYCGDFYGQSAEGAPVHEAITPVHLIDVIAGLPPGTTELGCHPGDGRDSWSVYDGERALEVDALCDPAVRNTVTTSGIELRSFSELIRTRPGEPGAHPSAASIRV